MSGVACPMCGSEEYERRRAGDPPKKHGMVTFRRHRCVKCKHLFATAQVALTNRIAEQILTLIEPPISSSDKEPAI